MLEKIRCSPVLVRVVPFAVFALLTMFQGRFGETSQYWVYALKTLVGAALIWLVRRQIQEMRWKISWEAVLGGIVVFAVWVGIDGFYPLLAARSASFNPLKAYGQDSAPAWAFVATRLLGSSLVVPPLEEVFYRSFLYRFIIRSDFHSVALSRFDLKAFLLAGAVFGLGHYEWLPGILCAFVYQALVCRKGRLGDAMTAHAITNFLLGLWVVGFDAYRFW